MRVARVAEIADQIRGVTYEKSVASGEPQENYIPILRAGNIQDFGLDLRDLIHVPQARVSSKQLIRSGDVVIAASSGSRDIVGKAAQVRTDFTGSFGAFCKVLRPSADVDPRYFGHFFRTAEYRARMTQVAAGANINNLRTEHLNDLEIPLPPIDEQRRIAEVLDQVDKLREKRRRSITLLDDITQSVFLDMFGNPATNPYGWDVIPLGQLGQVQGGLQVTSKRNSFPLEVPYLRVANVYRNRLDLGEIKTIRVTEREFERIRLQDGDLLIVEGHGNSEEIGRVAVWDGSIASCVHQNHLIRVRLAANVLSIYASIFLNTKGGRRHLLRAASTTSGLNTISSSDVRSTPIMVPPLALQTRFVETISKRRRIQTTYQAALGALDRLFASLQHRAFHGEL